MIIIKFFNLKWLITAIVTTAGVIFLTHLPQEIVPEKLQENDFDKIHHVIAYGIITLFFVLSLRNSFSLLSAVILFFFILTIATLDEFTQSFVNRQASPIDWLADMIGIAAVLFSFFFFTSSKRQPSADVGM